MLRAVTFAPGALVITLKKAFAAFVSASYWPLAWGELATCYLQWAQAKGQYEALTNAANAFLRVITNAPGANVTARSIATVGLGVVLEAQAEHSTVPGEQIGLLDLGAGALPRGPLRTQQRGA